MATTAKRLMSLRHSRLYIHVPHTDGERIADAVSEQMGSWRFIIIQSIVVGLWILVNLVAAALRWDPYPFILLNLLFSTQAAYAAPIIMMSQNRQAAKDRMRDDHEAAEVDEMYTIQEQQLAILEGQNMELAGQDEILALVKELLLRSSGDVVPEIAATPAAPSPEPVLVNAGPPPATSTAKIIPAAKPAPSAPSAPPVPLKAKKGAVLVPGRRKRRA